MKQMQTSALPVLLAAMLFAGATAGKLLAQDTGSGAESASVAGEIERIRDATKAFHDITAAHAAGYPTTVPGCLENPPHGGMGHHYVHPELMDDHLEVERPEILVYMPTKDGDLKLAGVEYVVPYSARSRDEEAPRILGQNLKPSDPLQIWYLHVWVWEENSNGMFADWNPSVRCSPKD